MNAGITQVRRLCFKWGKNYFQPYKIQRDFSKCKQTSAFSHSSCPETRTLKCQEPFQYLNHVINAGESLKRLR